MAGSCDRKGIDRISALSSAEPANPEKPLRLLWLPPSPAHKKKHLSCNARGSVQDNVLPAPGPRWQIVLVPLIQARDDACREHRNIAPAQRPSGICRRRQSISPRPEQQNAKQSVAEHMPAFSDVVVPGLKCRMVDLEYEMKQWVQKLAGVIGREISGRFDRNHDQPQGRGNPGFDEMLLVRAQASG
jgi:hypothetical protein